MSDVIQSDRYAALAHHCRAVAKTLPGSSYWRVEVLRDTCGGYHCTMQTREGYEADALASSADLRAKLDVAREALERIADRKALRAELSARYEHTLRRLALATIGGSNAE